MSAPAAPAGPAPLLAFHDLTLGYDRRPALGPVGGVVNRGDLLALVGPNGSGKSTLLKGIVGEAEILGGRLELAGIAPAEIAYLPQVSGIDRDFPIGLSDFVSFGAWGRRGAWGGFGRGERRRVADAIARVALNGLERRPIGALSGGQMQRALFARVILQDAPLILLDEPLTGIDEPTGRDLLEVIAGWGREGRTVLAALHDLRHVRAVFTRTLLLGRDRAVSGATASVLSSAELAGEVPAARAAGPR